MSKLLRPLILFLLLFGTYKTSIAQNQNLIKHIQELQATVENRRAVANIGKIRPDGKYLLPIGLLKSGDGSKPAILIDAISLYPTYAEVTAYAAFKLPGSDKQLYFGSIQPVKVSYKGGVLGDARLNLLEDKEINILGDDTKLKIKASAPGIAGSFIEFNCNGFSRANLTVEGELSQKLVPEINGVADPNQRVKALFSLEFADLNDIIASVSIQPFQIRSIPGLGFEVQNATIDLSDLSNSSIMRFPPGYTNDYYPGGSDIQMLWRGFYLDSLKLKLPHEFKDKSANGARKEIQLNHMIIDNHGFSGEVVAQNVFNLTNGDMDGWSYSLEKIALGFKANQLISGSLGGKVVLPIAEDKELAYDAFVTVNPYGQHLDFGFTVQTRSDLDFKIFKAGNVTLAAGSSINVNNIGGNFKANAILNGAMSISASLTDSENTSDANKAKIASVSFQNLNISTSAPYLNSGVFSSPSAVDAKIGNFGLSITAVGLSIQNGNSSLAFTAGIGLGDGNSSFTGTTSLTIRGNVAVNSSGRQVYTYTNTELNSVSLNVNQGSFKLQGALAFYREDPTYGSGFSGALQVTMPMKITVAASALFGRTSGVDGYQYWYTDALVTGIHLPIFPAVNISGFSGGLYYKVKQRNSSFGASPLTQTALNYIPDESIGFGIKAGVLFELTKNPKIMNGDLGFEVAFNSGGGINRVALMGNAYLMEQPVQQTSMLTNAANSMADKSTTGDLQNLLIAIRRNAMLTGSILMEYSYGTTAHPEEHLFVQTGISINIGSGIITGQANGEAYFSSTKWNVYLGKPDNKNTLSVLNFVNFSSYFMAGNLPASYLSINVPSSVTQAIGLSYKGLSRSTGSLAGGRGLGFGASLNFNLNSNFLVFYANIAAGAGFDILLADYQNSVTCNGSPIGINGWYANGSMWAYANADIGIRVRIFRKSRSFQILKISAGALLQASFPNPNYAHGAIGGQYRILGGLIKGNCRFQFSVGQKCNVVATGEVLESNMKIISEISPYHGEETVSTGVIPKVTFDIPIDEVIYGTDIDSVEKRYRATVEQFKVMCNGSPILGALQWNANKTEVSFTPNNFLPSNALIEASIRVSFYNVADNIYLKDSLENVYYETVKNTFKTGDAVLGISESNTAYAYPFKSQKAYFRNEYANGYVGFSRNLSNLFSANSVYRVEGKITDGVNSWDLNLSYNTNDNSINYSMPTLALNTNYHLIIRAVSIDSVSFNSLYANELDEDGNVILYQNYFRTSNYSTMQEKLNSSTFDSYYYCAGMRDISITGPIVEPINEDELNLILTNKHFELNILEYSSASINPNSFYDRYGNHGGYWGNINYQEDGFPYDPNYHNNIYDEEEYLDNFGYLLMNLSYCNPSTINFYRDGDYHEGSTEPYNFIFNINYYSQCNDIYGLDFKYKLPGGRVGGSVFQYQ